ncbi:CoA transferase [Pseudorhodoplanes sp.]|uniref:CaiB/BaiF CoA transferase family protein n=1 Tax=Pseudorhodoplanes sp. TaxID=1934341 RepID=UPI002CCC29F6|nr:CoA transferase [Pseudorhodoplanes sp.]HWV41651.1 CoA transferase [Pseudorhodoplanes sp.]
MTQPLDGILVIELGTMITAPLAGMMLADLGARVIKVEHPKGGDPFRAYRGDLYSPHFSAYNRNKESIQLDLQSESGQAKLHKLLSRADVLLDNYRPGVLARLRLDDVTLEKLNPRLVRCSITGFGDSGPYRDRPAYDSVGIAMSGIASLLLDPQRPDAAGPTIADNVTGMYACYGILAALLSRAVTGKGARVATNMLESGIAFIPDTFATFARLGIVSGSHTRVSTSQSYAFACADDRMLALHLSTPDKFWKGLLAAIERPELADDERFSTRDARVTHYEVLKAELAAAFRTQPRAEWCRRLEAEDVPHAPIWSADEVIEDPQVQHLRTFYEMQHPRLGTVTGIERPVLIDGERGPHRMPAPALGEHNAKIAAEFGLD